MNRNIYNKDVAELYVQSFGKQSTLAGEAVLRVIQSMGLEDALVVDLGCGPGTIARQISDAGHRVIGCDISPHMIALANEHAPEADLKCTSYMEFSIPPCDIVIAIGEVFSFDSGNEDHFQLLEYTFQRIYKALKPGGVLIFDVSTIDSMPEDPIEFYIEDHEDWCGTIQADFDFENKRTHRTITTFRKVNGGYRKSSEEHHMVIYEAWQINQALQNAGFMVTTSRSIDQYQLVNGYTSFWAKKKSEYE
ncbi:MAG: class I SAM-dependent methyltransferase [Armatimonadetes bacterium]|nr:class I SAM-dependent methyltransferase [Armatimonadota bacterium]